MQSTSLEKLSAADAKAILEYLPERIRAALIARAAEEAAKGHIRRVLWLRLAETRFGCANWN